jgi:hypothetical protein
MPQRAVVVLSDEDREVLERWARRPNQPAGVGVALPDRFGRSRWRAEWGDRGPACRTSTVGRWRRFARRGFDGLHDEPWLEKPRSIGDQDVERVIVKTLEEQPPNATHWSTRSMAQATGMRQTAISRIWRAFGLKSPIRPRTSSCKVRDIVGLYLNRPERAVVLCVDEENHPFAINRRNPSGPSRDCGRKEWERTPGEATKPLTVL